MTYEEIMQLETTMSSNNSQKVFLELLYGEWRFYSNQVTPVTDELIDRFLQSHARMPGFVTDEILAVVPVEIFGWRTDSGVGTHGALFTNGAVLSITGEGKQVKLLFIDEATAHRWGYPDGYSVRSERANEESAERPVQT